MTPEQLQSAAQRVYEKDIGDQYVSNDEVRRRVNELNRQRSELLESLEQLTKRFTFHGAEEIPTGSVLLPLNLRPTDVVDGTLYAQINLRRDKNTSGLTGAYIQFFGPDIMDSSSVQYTVNLLTIGFQPVKVRLIQTEELPPAMPEPSYAWDSQVTEYGTRLESVGQTVSWLNSLYPIASEVS
jgi:hypothetical protein